MKKVKKIIFVLVIIILIFCLEKNFVFADDLNVASNFSGTSSTEGENIIKGVVTPILSAVQLVASGVGAIMITYLGIKYMSAAPSERANIKNQLVTLAVGFIVAVSAVQLIKIMQTFTETNIV